MVLQIASILYTLVKIDVVPLCLLDIFGMCSVTALFDEEFTSSRAVDFVCWVFRAVAAVVSYELRFFAFFLSHLLNT